MISPQHSANSCVAYKQIDISLTSTCFSYFCPLYCCTSQNYFEIFQYFEERYIVEIIWVCDLILC